MEYFQMVAVIRYVSACTCAHWGITAGKHSSEFM